MAGLQYLKDKFKQVYQNFNDDPYVNRLTDEPTNPKVLREIFFEEIEKLTDPDTFVKNVSSICGMYTRRGPKQTQKKGLVGGTATPFSAFLIKFRNEINRHLSENPQLGSGAISLNILEKIMLDAGTKKDIKGLKTLIKDFELENVPIRIADRIMWCFTNEHNDSNIFEGMTKDEICSLPCTLGLDPETFDQQYICYGHILSIDFFKPTAMDAGLNQYWRPGGKTQPLNSCANMNGKNEFVHLATALKNFNWQIEVFDCK